MMDEERLRCMLFFMVSGQQLTDSRIQELDKWQLSKRITKYPSILEFLGYS